MHRKEGNINSYESGPEWRNPLTSYKPYRGDRKPEIVAAKTAKTAPMERTYGNVPPHNKYHESDI